VGIRRREFLLVRRYVVSPARRPTRVYRGDVRSGIQRGREDLQLQWAFDVRFLADEPYHSLTPLQPSEHRPYAWVEAPASLNELLNRLAS
jgi:hypothetical protein